METPKEDKQDLLNQVDPEEKKVRRFIKYTLDGVVILEEKDGWNTELPMEEETLKPPPEKFLIEHHSEINLFHSVLRILKRRKPNRSVPITRRELLLAGARPKTLRELVEMGLLAEDTVPVIKEGGEAVNKSCMFYTPQGRAYVRAKIDPSYLK